MNTPPKPPDPPIFFIDHSLGTITIADAIRDAGEEIRILREHFPENIRDRDLLKKIGERRWVFLTKDERIRYRSVEQAALVEASVGAFVLTSGNLSASEMAHAFVKAIPAMKRFMSRIPPPFIARVTRTGRVEAIYPEKKSKRPT